MKISQFSASELAGALRRGELLLTISPFVVRIKTDVTSLAEDISVMYSDFHVCRFDAFADFHVEIARETITGIEEGQNIRGYSARAYLTSNKQNK